MLDWTGTSVTVTGAASGIGCALVEALVARGARVLAADIAREPLEALAVRLGDAVRVEVCDVADPQAVEALAARPPASSWVCRTRSTWATSTPSATGATPRNTSK